jgi:hypothetical protein
MLGARAPTQLDGLAFADQNTFQATLDGENLWIGCLGAKDPVHSYREFACCRHFGHGEVFLMATVQIFLAKYRIKAHGYVRSFNQKESEQSVSLFADPAHPLLASR